MKKLVSLILAGVMTFGASALTFADEVQDTPNVAVVAAEDDAVAEVDTDAEAADTATAPVIANMTADDYKIVIDGREISYSKDNTKFRDGTPIFPAKELAENFPSLKVDEAKIIATTTPFTYSHVDYYAVEDVAKANGFNFFYDRVTNTALVTNADTYNKIVTLMQSVDNQTDVNSMDIDMAIKMNLAMNISGLDELLADADADTVADADAEAPVLTDTSMDQTLAMDMSGNIKMDIAKKFMSANMDISAMDEKMNVQMYDDGNHAYVKDSATNTWMKSESSMAMIDTAEFQNIVAAAPVLSPTAIGLTYGGLEYAETANEITISGTMYLGETFKELNLDKIVEQAMAQNGVDDLDADIKIDWPEAMQVNYVFDKSGNIKTMGMRMSIGYNVTVEGITVELGADVDATITRYRINPELNTTVPADVVKNAITFDQYLDSLPAPDLSDIDVPVDTTIQGGSIYDKVNTLG